MSYSHLPIGAVLFLAIDDALTLLTTEDPDAAEVVMLRLFAGLTVEQAANALDEAPADERAGNG